MNLLNRYLQEVARYLPKARRDDIVAELRANLAAQMEDREEELGRPLTEDEQAAILRHHGHPATVAARYRDDNLGFAFGVQLIGPELFPFYKTVLLIILSISAVLISIAAVVVKKTTGETLHAGRVGSSLAIQLSIATLIFILVNRGREHWSDRWDPRKLPAMKVDPEDGLNAQRVFRFVLLVVGTAWWAAAPRSPFLLLGPVTVILPAVPLKLMPQWTGFYWAILVLLGGQVALEFSRLFRWLPRHAARMADLALRVAGLCIGVVLLLKFPAYVSSPQKDFAEWANLSFLVCVIVAVAINLLGIGRLLLRERHQMLPARQH